MQTLTHSTDRGGHGDGVWTKPTRILLLVAIPALAVGPRQRQDIRLHMVEAHQHVQHRLVPRELHPPLAT